MCDMIACHVNDETLTLGWQTLPLGLLLIRPWSLCSFVWKWSSLGLKASFHGALLKQEIRIQEEIGKNIILKIIKKTAKFQNHSTILSSGTSKWSEPSKGLLLHDRNDRIPQYWGIKCPHAVCKDPQKNSWGCLTHPHTYHSVEDGALKPLVLWINVFTLNGIHEWDSCLLHIPSPWADPIQFINMCIYTWLQIDINCQYCCQICRSRTCRAILFAHFWWLVLASFTQVVRKYSLSWRV